MEDRSMDALELLKEDHQKVKELFEEAEGTEDEKAKQQIFEKIRTELETHAQIEETVFYPAMENHKELKEMVAESRKEHQQIKGQLKQLESLSPEHDEFDANLASLMECVEHHAAEEEEGKMFPKVRELCDQQELDDLGEELEAAKGRKRKAS